MDRTYFEITCRNADTYRFERQGFIIRNSDGQITTMEDADADPSVSRLPRDIPWYGWNATRFDITPMAHACDGKDSISVETGIQDHERFVVRMESGNMHKEDRDRLIQYKRVLKRAIALVAGLKLPKGGRSRKIAT